MVTTPSVEFPFSAIAGQEKLKLALTLAAINPLLGGVLISGPRGSAKSTLARGLAAVLPDENAEFVTLPLGASEDRLLGTLDLNKVLSEKEMVFQPGLLSKAHGGILYVDEVNLLADNLVDQLLDVAASGRNRVERDGISHEHAAKFLLIGTMNPDEGELRSQLQDRFGLMVSLTNNYSLEERVQIVKRRDEFDQNPEPFCLHYAQEQEDLKRRIALAQLKLSTVHCNDSIRMEIARRCQQANVDGMRADIVWLRAASAATALRNAVEIEIQDIDLVEEFVLAHRRHDGGASDHSDHSSHGNDGQPQDPTQKRRPQNSVANTANANSLPTSNHPLEGNSNAENGINDSSSDDDKSNGANESEWGSMPPQRQNQSQNMEKEYSVMLAKADSKRMSNRYVKAGFIGKQKGEDRFGYQRHAYQRSHQVDWHSTLVESGLKNEWPPERLQYKKNKTGQSMLHLIVLDASASTLKNALFSKAKSLIADIAYQAYLRREQIAIFAFGNDKVEQISPQIRSPKDVSQLLNELKAGGGTPFREAMLQVQHWLNMARRKMPSLANHTYIVTDGRTKADVSDIRLAGMTSVIDTEDTDIKRGRGALIAQSLQANYIPVR